MKTSMDAVPRIVARWFRKSPRKHFERHYQQLYRQILPLSISGHKKLAERTKLLAEKAWHLSRRSSPAHLQAYAVDCRVLAEEYQQAGITREYLSRWYSDPIGFVESVYLSVPR